MFVGSHHHIHVGDDATDVTAVVELVRDVVNRQCVLTLKSEGDSVISARFDNLRTGEVLDEPADENLRIYESRTEDGAVWVKI